MIYILHLINFIDTHIQIHMYSAGKNNRNNSQIWICTFLVWMPSIPFLKYSSQMLYKISVQEWVKPRKFITFLILHPFPTHIWDISGVVLTPLLPQHMITSSCPVSQRRLVNLVFMTSNFPIMILENITTSCPFPLCRYINYYLHFYLLWIFVSLYFIIFIFIYLWLHYEPIWVYLFFCFSFIILFKLVNSLLSNHS